MESTTPPGGRAFKLGVLPATLVKPETVINGAKSRYLLSGPDQFRYLRLQYIVTTDGKDGHGLKLEKVGPTFSSFNSMPAKKRSSQFFAGITALFTNMQIMKFKSQLTIAFFAAVNHLNGPLRKQNFTLKGSKGHGL